jgi:hypothetical protein
VHTISADHLAAVLAAHKLRRYSAGQTCQLCALTAAPLVSVDCHEGRKPLAVPHRALVSPMQRGRIHSLYTRTRLQHGLAEVRRTWGAGLRALLAEPAHVLNGGKP